MRYFFLAFALLVLTVMSVAGLRGSRSRQPPREIFPDMDRQLKLRPQTSARFFADGLSSRIPVAGTIPRSQPLRIGNQDVYPFENHPVNTGRLSGGTNWITANPLPVSAQRLARGRERFQIFCSPCHGAQGTGQGIVSKYNWPVISNFHEQRIILQPDGEIFNTISYGKNTMSGYAEKISAADRWAIVAYVRALQLSRLAVLEDVPEDKQALLNP